MYSANLVAMKCGLLSDFKLFGRPCLLSASSKLVMILDCRLKDVHLVVMTVAVHKA